jgi:outer membrane protein X
MAYGHYLFPVAEKLTVYPLAGLGVMGYSADFKYNIPGIGSGSISDSGSDFVFALGGGVDYELSDKLILNGEAKFFIKDGSRFILSVGLAYRF